MKKKYQKPKIIEILIDIKELIKATTERCNPGCPYLFLWNGKEYIVENSILPDSEDLLRKEKVLNDYYVLKNEPSLKDGDLSFKIREFENEVSWFDRFSLLTLEHLEQYEITYSNQNMPLVFNYHNLLKPKLSKDQNNKDLTKNFNKNEFSIKDYYSSQPGEYLYMEFKIPETEWLKFLIYDPKKDSFRLVGIDDCIPGKGGCKDSIHVYVYLNNELKKIDILHTRAEFYPDIIDLTPYLPQIKGNLKIKLEFTSPHKVAFVGIDTTPPIPIKKRVYKLKEAIHSDLGDVTDTLREENNQFARLMPGEEIELKFPIPEPAKIGNKLSYCLVSRGYYIPTTKILSLARSGKLVASLDE